MKIKITEDNRDAIDAAIKEVEGRAKARTCTHYDVEKLVQYAEDKLKKYGVAKSHWSHCRAAYVEHIGVKAYSKFSYTADTTRIDIERGATDWYLTGATRVTINPSIDGQDFNIHPTDKIIDIVERKAVERFLKE